MDETLSADLARTVMGFAGPERPDPERSAAELPSGGARYLPGKLIGRGGMGKVVEAEDRQFGRKVALKTMLAADRDDRIQRFGIEAVVTANLDHPGIPAVYERGHDEQGNPFYAMRLVRGRSLEQAIAACKTLDDRLRLLPALIDVCQTLAFAHARGVIHRDIKPDNVVVGAYGDTVVIDWGVAKVRGVAASSAGPERSAAQAIADTTGGTATRDGAVIGTPAYMAPEQALGQVEQVDERSDVFSLGALLYHLFSGHPPYRGRTSMEALTRAIEGEYEPLDEVAPQTPPALRAIVARAMAKAPDQRYPSAGALAEALQEVIAEGVRERGSKAVRLFANATSLVLTVVMLLIVAALLIGAPLAELGVFGYLLLPTFGLGAALAGIEWWTIGRHRLSPLVLGLAVVTALEGMVAAALGRMEMAQAIGLMHDEAAAAGAPIEPLTLGLAYLRGSQTIGLSEIVGMQLCAALIVLYAVARYRIATAQAPVRSR